VPRSVPRSSASNRRDYPRRLRVPVLRCRPSLALVIAWAITWPLAVWSYAHWNLGLLRVDQAMWRSVMSGEQRPDSKSVFLHILLAAGPAALFLSVWKT
jgi:hypothetical protein